MNDANSVSSITMNFSLITLLFVHAMRLLAKLAFPKQTKPLLFVFFSFERDQINQRSFLWSMFLSMLKLMMTALLNMFFPRKNPSKNKLSSTSPATMNFKEK